MIPDALKPAICDECGGEGTDYLTLHGVTTDTPWGSCWTCGGSGINPDMIHENEQGFGRYVVIPLGGSNETDH